jgi:hypothetical protein
MSTPDPPTPDLPAASVTVDRAVLFGVLDDMADAALALGDVDGDDVGPAERLRCREALHAGIAEMWMQANLSELQPKGD